MEPYADRENERILKRDGKDPLVESPYSTQSILSEDSEPTADGVKTLLKGKEDFTQKEQKQSLKQDRTQSKIIIKEEEKKQNDKDFMNAWREKRKKDLWQKTFNLKSVNDSFIPAFKPEVKEALNKALKGEEIKLTNGSLIKLIERDRTDFIP